MSENVSSSALVPITNEFGGLIGFQSPNGSKSYLLDHRGRAIATAQINHAKAHALQGGFNAPAWDLYGNPIAGTQNELKFSAVTVNGVVTSYTIGGHVHTYTDGSPGGSLSNVVVN